MNLFTQMLYEYNLITDDNSTDKPESNASPKAYLSSKAKTLKESINLKNIQNFIIVAVTITFFLGITNFAAKSEEISDSVLRLHILANSDSEADQALKLKVRDAVLESGQEAFSGAENVKEAEELIIAGSDVLLETAKAVIEKEGYDYDVTLEITDDSFPTRTYGDVTLPAGEYRAVRLVIGEGEGHNWWCVMFPALCLPGASETSLDAVLTDDEIELVESDPEIDVRFKIAEVFENIRVKVKEAL